MTICTIVVGCMLFIDKGIGEIPQYEQNAKSNCYNYYKNNEEECCDGSDCSSCENKMESCKDENYNGNCCYVNCDTGSCQVVFKVFCVNGTIAGLRFFNNGSSWSGFSRLPFNIAGYSVTYGDGKNYFCELCETGHYNTEGESPAGCYKCKIGKYSDEKGASECKPCEYGKYANIEGSTECKTCPKEAQPVDADGNVVDSGAVSCRCPGGSEFDVNTNTCVKCAPGTYAQAWAPRCTPCAKYTYSDEEGAIECKSCTPPIDGKTTGFFPVDENNNFVNSGATKCLNIPAGQCLSYSAVNDNWALEICGVGTYSAGGIGCPCKQCVGGITVDASGNQTSTGAVACKLCPVGSFLKF